MTLKQGETYKTKTGVEVEIIKAPMTYPGQPRYEAIGLFKAGNMMYFSLDGTCPGNPSMNLEVPKKVGWTHVYGNPECKGLPTVAKIEYEA